MQKPVVYLAVDARTSAYTEDDRQLVHALQVYGVEARPLSWKDAVECGATVVIRSTYDYVEDPARFTGWLDQLDEARPIVRNPTSLLRWNMRKGYLLGLARAGARSFPPSSFPAVRRSRCATWNGANGRRGHQAGRWCDSASARSMPGAPVDNAEQHLRTVVASEDVLVQPYQRTIMTWGETSVIAVHGEPHLAVSKQARTGEWRVQSDFGGDATRAA
ncbi:MAG: hypothetical protein U0163_07560 [Gemmatimonadaceae bacterium]